MQAMKEVWAFCLKTWFFFNKILHLLYVCGDDEEDKAVFFSRASCCMDNEGKAAQLERFTFATNSKTGVTMVALGFLWNRSPSLTERRCLSNGAHVERLFGKNI